MNFYFILSILAQSVCGLNVETETGTTTTVKVGDVIKSIEDATKRQEDALRSTTKKLHAIQQRVNSLVAH